MRVLHWFPNYFHGGGVANAVTGLAHAQANLGAEVAVAGARDDRRPMYGEPPQHAHVERLHWRPSADIGVAGLTARPPSREALAMLRAWRPDVVHAHAEFAPDNIWTRFIFD